MPGVKPPAYIGPCVPSAPPNIPASWPALLVMTRTRTRLTSSIPEDYAVPTAITIFVLIGLAGIISWSRLLVSRKRPTRLVAAVRWLSYKRVPWLDISLANASGITAVFIAFFIYTFAFGQIYRMPKLSPAGLRAGYIAIAMCPFVFTWGSRINPLAWLTRISHEKWMVYHQYGARIIVFFSLLHALLIIHSKYLLGGWEEVQAYWATRAVPNKFWSKPGLLVNGILALGTMVWMIFSSVFRHKSYEFFVIQHVISVLVVVVSLLAHLQVDLDVGIHFVYAFTGVWVFSVLVRFSYNVLAALGVSKWQGKASIIEMPHGATAIEVDVRGKGTWKAGQHVYLRLPGLNLFQSHPFTIASATTSNTSSQDAEKDSSPQKLRLLIKTRAGLTRKLARKAARAEPESPHPRLRVIIEGPYGHFSERLEAFDEVLLVAGGVGGTYTWPIAEYLTEKGKGFKMVWTVRSAACLEWFASSRVDRQAVQIHISDPMYSSTASSQTAIGSAENLEKSGAGDSNVPSLLASTSTSTTPNGSQSGIEKLSEKRGVNELLPSLQGGSRLNMTTVVEESIGAAAKGSRIAILTCGPAAMLNDIGRAVAAAEWQIAAGKSDVKEIWLHREAFGH